MPSASSVNHIMASIAEIAHALKHLLPNSSLASLADSQSTALHKIMEVINGAVPTAPTKTTPLEPATSKKLIRTLILTQFFEPLKLYDK